jgi:hypothetical protein
MKTVKPNELKLGDVVRLVGLELAYDCSTVVKVEIDRITLFRPYVHCSPYVTKDEDRDGRTYRYILKYIGIQDEVIPFTSKKEYYLLQSGDVKG